MIIGPTLLLALGAALGGTVVYWLLTLVKVNQPWWPWVCRWIGLAVALYLMATGVIQIGK